jgi:hypothetical protein
MAAALVGTLGAVVVSSSGGSAVTAWGTGSRVAGDLLVLWVAVTGGTTDPATPSGWTKATAVTWAQGAEAYIYYKIALGSSDSAPTVAAVSGAVISAQVGAFSGLDPVSPLDHATLGGPNTTTLVISLPSTDTSPGELYVCAFALEYSTAATKTTTDNLNNGMTPNVSSNDGVSTVSHYHFTWAITTSNVGNDSNSFTFTTTKITEVTAMAASFKLAGSPPPGLRTVVSQAVTTAATRMSVYRRKSGILVPRIWLPERAVI